MEPTPRGCPHGHLIDHLTTHLHRCRAGDVWTWTGTYWVGGLSMGPEAVKHLADALWDAQQQLAVVRLAGVPAPSRDTYRAFEKVPDAANVPSGEGEAP